MAERKVMIYTVVRNNADPLWNMKIVGRCDAWEQGGEARLRREARDAGWVPMESQITFNGDMIIWVE